MAVATQLPLPLPSVVSDTTLYLYEGPRGNLALWWTKVNHECQRLHIPTLTRSQQAARFGTETKFVNLVNGQAQVMRWAAQQLGWSTLDHPR